MRRVTVADDGERVVYLRRAGAAGEELWVYDVSRGAARLVAGGRPGAGITGYTTDAAARTAAFTVDGRLHRADLSTGAVGAVPTSGPSGDPRPDPTGERIGYLTAGALHVVDGTGADLLLAGEPDPGDGGRPHVSWGRPDPAGAHHFGRDRGWWWAPDGRSILASRVDAARAPRVEVSLHLLDLDGGWVDVHWDRETYPYLVSVGWAPRAHPLVAVLRRGQQQGLVLAVDSRTGETQVHAELADPRWVEPVPGTPCHLADGRVLVGGELAHDGYDARCLFADGALLTPPSLYVRRVVGRLPGTAGILVEASAGEPSEQHLFRIGTGATGVDAHRITASPGWHRAAVGGGTLVIGSESLDHPGTRWTVWRGERAVGELARDARNVPAPAELPRPALGRVTDRRLPAGVLYPRWHVTGRRLPVLVDANGLDQGVRAVRADWSDRQWWADAGFAVVVVDHRGTPGVAPSFEKVVHRRLADLALTDLADGLAGLAGKHPDLALDRVAVKGRGVGGWLAVLAVLRRPEWFRCTVAQAPVVDWADCPGGFAERYLGLPDERAEVYERHCLLTAAVQDSSNANPLLLIPDPADPDPVARLAEVLRATEHPVVVQPSGSERLPDAVLEFLHAHL